MKILRGLLLLFLMLSLVIMLAGCGEDNNGDGTTPPTPSGDCTAGHTYDNDCDRICNVCEERRDIEHVYDSSCDTECNICGIPHTPIHAFDNECDTECNNCRAQREAVHTYTDSCDKECNVCKAVRTVEHSYDNACDPVCNVCREVRTVGDHVFIDECDTSCDECDAKRAEPPHLDTDNNGRCDLCDEVLFVVVPADKFDLPEIPIYDGVNAYTVINGNIPFFLPSQIAREGYEFYTELDSLGRCGVAVGCLGPETLPTGNRGSISHVSPSGWQSSPPIYERCHLIAWSLSGEDANRKNLITGTYILNGIMQEFEDMVCDYIKDTKNHVMYRSTPVFEGDNLVARGIFLEAYSVEDAGEGIEFCIFIHNVQTDYVIDYASGYAELTEDAMVKNYKFVINASNYKIHLSTCRYVSDIKESNKIFMNGSYQDVVDHFAESGITTSYCKTCKPQNSAKQIVFIIPEKQLCPIITSKKRAA